MPVLVRYVLLQLPGWALASGLLYAAWSGWGLSGPLALGGLAAWIAKDFVLYPFVRSAYALAPSKLIGPEQLIGRAGVAEDALSPSGHVWIGGERWRAESSDPVPPGGRVRVRLLRGLTLHVEPIREPDDG
jgi:membrane-bound serine protease (ClpP class)